MQPAAAPEVRAPRWARRFVAACLAVVRIGLCLLLAARLATGRYLELAEQPAALFRPISFLRLLDRMPPRGLVLAVQVLAVAAAGLAAARPWARGGLPLALGG